MEENKNLNPEIETEKVKTEETVSSEAVVETENNKKVKTTVKKARKPKKAKLLKNEALFKKGGYSIAITAAVLIGVIVFNILVGALSDRFVLEFDMSTDKVNSISQENIDYIKKIDKEINVTVCADPESYVGGYMAYYAQQYNVTSDASEYYKQTINLIDKYEAYNDKINVKYVDVQSNEFSALSSQYPNETLNYGDIIVSCDHGTANRYKKIGFTDIYSVQEDNTYASYGYTTATVSGNNIETALTSAIAYATSSETKKIAMLTGHSNNDYTANYKTLLTNNNYEVEIVADSIVTSIPESFDAIVIAAPTVDFIESELDAISKFLDNGGKYGKGLIFYGDVSAPYLTNFYDLLAQWGIVVDEGILYETYENNHLPDDPTTLGTYSSGKDSISDSVNICITGKNIPLSVAEGKVDYITVTSVLETPETVIAAPKGTTAGWKDADKYTKQSYSSVIQSLKSDYDADNNLIESYVMAFSSIDFIYSEYVEQASVSNKEISLAAADRASGATNTGISFISKTITNESFADKVTESSANIIQMVFMFALPIVLIVLGIFIYIKRRNA